MTGPDPTPSVTSTRDRPRHRVAIVLPWHPPAQSAVTEYAIALARRLACDAQVHLVLAGCPGPIDLDDLPSEVRCWPQPGRPGPLAAARLAPALSRIAPHSTLLQYSPFAWNPRGLDLAGPVAALASRRAGVPVDVVFHEMWTPLSMRPLVLARGLLQRVVAAWLATLARTVVVTSRERIAEIARFAPSARARLAPMPSLVEVRPISPARRRATRLALGLDDGVFALGILGFDHESKPTAPLWRLRRRLAAAGVGSRLVVLGPARVAAPEDEPPDAGSWPIHVGRCPGERASELLQCLDLFVAWLVDGVSTRRTSVAAALAHGVPVLATDGAHTDHLLYSDGALELVPVPDPDRFARAALDLALDPARRLALGRRGQELYARHLDWPGHLGVMREVMAS